MDAKKPSENKNLQAQGSIKVAPGGRASVNINDLIPPGAKISSIRRASPPGTIATVDIATPSYRSQFSAQYVHSLFSVVAKAASRKIHLTYSNFDGAEIVTARNYMISNFYYNKPHCTHLLFIDDDMGFDSKLIFSMIDLKQDLVGVIAPKRSVDLRKLHAAKDLPFEQAYAKALDFIGIPKAVRARKSVSISAQVSGQGSVAQPKVVQSKLDVQPFMEVESCGAGIMLISRACIDRMIVACPDVVDTVRFKRHPFLAKDFKDKFLVPFNPIVTEKRAMSEDISFCYRWTDRCGGKVFAAATSSIKHVGQQIVEGRYSDSV
ncbi:MAG: hypothetical protein RL749_379 [Verrucomicrobiota bacterium]|jgi:hypothetical protein